MDPPEFDVRPHVARLSLDPLGVDTAPWAAAGHAYGAADDMPALLARAATGDAASARRSMDRLWSSAWHQGTVYSAAALATPVLLHAVSNPQACDRAACC